MIININNYKEQIDKLVADKVIRIDNHPTFPLSIYNYTHKCMYGKLWDDITEQCRGLIVNNLTGEIVSRCMRKFFNLGERDTFDTLPKESFKVFEKLDGSMIISYWYNGGVHFASRGSFTSEMANEADNLFNTKYLHSILNPEWTYIFEIIYPKNKIVVDYGDREELVLLALIDTKTGVELSLDTPEKMGFFHNFPIVQQFNGLDSPEKILQRMGEGAKENEEGIVIMFNSGFRVKVKTQEYMRIHKTISGCSTYSIWEHAKTGKPVEELLDHVPDEFFNWVEKVYQDLSYQYEYIENSYKDVLRKLTPISSRKEFALRAKETNYPSLLFLMLDNKEYSAYIWDLIKPKFEKAKLSEKLEG
jgi:RNA ligase